MLTRSKTISLALCASLTAGCAGQGFDNSLLGAGSGALAGALSGGLIGGNWKGALVGAAVGAALGWGTAKLLAYRSTQVRDPSTDRRIYGVTERVGSPLVKVRKGSNTPTEVRPGQQVKVSTDYSVVLPPGMTAAPVDESWILKKDGKVLTQLPSQRAERAGGGWEARASITIPKDAQPGTYVIEHKVQSGTSYDSDESTFVIDRG